MFKDFGPVLKILLRFILIYVVLILLYQLYLNTQIGLDRFSLFTAGHSTAIQNFLGFPSKLIEQPKYETAWFYIKNQFPYRMVEGCNAASIMILFVAFVFAFYKGFKTFIFVVVGLLLLYVINVLRIAGLNILGVEYPQYSKAGHDYFFPAIIYGSVVLLWLIWVKFFVLRNENH